MATDRHWVTDIRDQKFWLEGVNRNHKCDHFMYRGEGVFYGVCQDGTWRFGLKDLNTSHSRTGIIHRFPLEGAHSIHAHSCDNGKDKDDQAPSAVKLGGSFTEITTLPRIKLEHPEGGKEKAKEVALARTKKASKKASLILAGGLGGFGPGLGKSVAKKDGLIPPIERSGGEVVGTVAALGQPDNVKQLPPAGSKSIT